MDRRAWTALLALAAIWGASYLFIEIGLREMGPTVIAWARVTLAALVLVPIAFVHDQLRLHRAAIPYIVLLAAIQVAGPFILIARGQEEISSSLAGILVASTPLFTALLAIRIDPEERSDGASMWGIIAGLAGVALLLGLDLGDSSAELFGGLAIVAASLGYSLGGFLAKLRLPGAPPTGVAAWVMVASAILLAPAAAVGAPDEVPGLGPIAAVAALGIVGTGIAFAIFYGLMATVGPARTFVVTYLAPAFAVVYGAVLLDESVSISTIVGLVLIVGGSYLAAQGRRPRRGAPEPVYEAPASARSEDSTS